MKTLVDNIKVIDRLLSFDNQFYIITVLNDSNPIEYKSYFPESFIELHRFLPEIKHICKGGNATAYINVNPVNFQDAYDTIIKADDFQNYDTVRDTYIAKESRNNIVLDLSDRSTAACKQIVDIVKKYTDKYFRLDNFIGQSIVVCNPDNTDKFFDEISVIDGCTISYKVVLFGIKKD